MTREGTTFGSFTCSRKSISNISPSCHILSTIQLFNSAFSGEKRTKLTGGSRDHWTVQHVVLYRLKSKKRYLNSNRAKLIYLTCRWWLWCNLHRIGPRLCIFLLYRYTAHSGGSVIEHLCIAVGLYRVKVVDFERRDLQMCHKTSSGVLNPISLIAKMRHTAFRATARASPHPNSGHHL